MAHSFHRPCCSATNFDESPEGCGVLCSHIHNVSMPTSQSLVPFLYQELRSSVLQEPYSRAEFLLSLRQNIIG